MGKEGEVIALLRGEAGCNEQHGIGADNTGLQKLILVNDEILAQDRDIDQRACRADVTQGTAEESFVCKYGEGRSAAGFVGYGNFFRPGALVNPAFGGRTALELGDDACG